MLLYEEVHTGTFKEVVKNRRGVQNVQNPSCPESDTGVL